MDLYDSLLFLHVAAAFMIVAALVVDWSVIIAAARSQAFAPLAASIVRPGTVIVVVGSLAALVFGVWLAIDREEYGIFDGWILASIVLWAIATETGRRAGTAFGSMAERQGTEADELRRRGILLEAVTTVAVLVILVLMIFKPGA